MTDDIRGANLIIDLGIHLSHVREKNRLLFSRLLKAKTHRIIYHKQKFHFGFAIG